MKTHPSTRLPKEQGVGLVEVLIGIVISMLLVLMMFQVYVVAEGQKRTITSANDAQENASYGLFLLGQELASAGNIVAVSTEDAVERMRDVASDPGGHRGRRDRQRFRTR